MISEAYRVKSNMEVLSIKKHFGLTIATFLLGLASCHSGSDVTPQNTVSQNTVSQNTVPQEYRYFEKETTGLNAFLVLPRGGEQAIVFAPDSNQPKVRLLQALGYCGVTGTSAPIQLGSGVVHDQRLIVIGSLSGELRYTSEGRQLPTSESYREFVLTDWYLAAPFTVVATQTPETLDRPVRVLRSRTLSSVCPLIDMETPLDGFVRQTPPQSSVSPEKASALFK